MANFNKIFALAVLTALIFTSCNRQIVAQKEVKQYYYDCPMHKDYIAYKPGKCPTCGMTLDRWDMDKMAKRQANNDHSSHASGSSHSGHSGSGSMGGGSGSCH
jgi:hypothetical protein